jgi:hypothetical protein
MLNPETPFPYVGSYALYVDMDQPAPQREELVRIMWRSERMVAVSFPLRSGAGGNKAVLDIGLIDATPLSFEETREFHDLDRALFGRSLRTKRQQAANARRVALQRRAIWAPYMKRLLREMCARSAQQRRAA